MSVNTLIIIRGVPGCGKTTYAETIADENSVIRCTDDYHYINDIYCCELPIN